MTMTNAANTIASSPSETSAMNAEYLTGLLTRKESIEALLLSIEWKLLIFGVFVVLGVAGESWYGYKTWRGNKQLRAVQKDIETEQDRRFRAEADETKKEVARANDSAAHANERAAGLEREATVARLELEQLKEKSRPRTLTDEQAKKLTLAMVAVSGQKVDISATVGNAEALDFAMQISRSLSAAGMTVGPVGQETANVRGVAIIVKSQSTAGPVLVRLQAALISVGIETEGIVNAHWGNDSGTLMIGTKP